MNRKCQSTSRKIIIVSILVLSVVIAVVPTSQKSTSADSALQSDNVTRSLSWNPTGDLLAVGDDTGLWLYDTSFNLIDSTQVGGVWDIAWSPDGSQIAASVLAPGGGIFVWDVSTLNHLSTLRGTISEVSFPVAWSPDGSQIATSGGGRGITIYDAISFDQVQVLPGDLDFVEDISWSSDGQYIAMSVSWDGMTRIWDSGTGQLIRTLDDPSRASGYVHAWSPDSTKIATESVIWDAQTGTILQTFNSDELPIAKMIWGENGLLTDGFGSIRVWDPNTGAQLFELQLDWSIFGIDWHPTNGEITYSIDGLPPVTVDPFPGPICDPSFTIAGYSR